MDTRNEEQVVYLKDMVFAALYQWRKVLVAALILALLLGGFKAYRAWSALQTGVTDAAMEQYEIQRQTLTQQVSSLQSNIESQQTYLNNSLLMKLDPYSFYEARLTVYIDTDYQILPGMSYQNPDKTGAVANAYVTVLTGEAAAGKMAAAIGIENACLLELLSLETDSGTLTIRVKYADGTGAEKLLQAAAAQLEAAQTQIAQTIADHRISTVEQSIRQMKSAELASRQKAEAENLTLLRNELQTAEEELHNLMPPQGVTVSMNSVIKSAVIFAVIGGILGVFVAVCAAWVVHITGSKVYSARVLYNRTGVKILGCMAAGSTKNSIDRWLRKLEGRNAREPAQQAELLAVNTANLCGDIHRLLVIGSAEGAGRETLITALAQAMPGVQILDMGSLLHRSDAMKALKEADAVLLTEQCGVSRYADTAHTAATVSDHSKKLIGCVVLDG